MEVEPELLKKETARASAGRALIGRARGGGLARAPHWPPPALVGALISTEQQIDFLNKSNFPILHVGMQFLGSLFLLGDVLYCLLYSE